MSEFIHTPDGSMLPKWCHVDNVSVFLNGDQWYRIVKDKNGNDISGYVADKDRVFYMDGAIAQRVISLENPVVPPDEKHYFIVAVTNVRNPGQMTEPKPVTNLNNERIIYQTVSISSPDKAVLKDTLIRWFNKSTFRM